MVFRVFYTTYLKNLPLLQVRLNFVRFEPHEHRYDQRRREEYAPAKCHQHLIEVGYGGGWRLQNEFAYCWDSDVPKSDARTQGVGRGPRCDSFLENSCVKNRRVRYQFEFCILYVYTEWSQYIMIIRRKRQYWCTS